MVLEKSAEHVFHVFQRTLNSGRKQQRQEFQPRFYIPSFDETRKFTHPKGSVFLPFSHFPQRGLWPCPGVVVRLSVIPQFHLRDMCLRLWVGRGGGGWVTNKDLITLGLLAPRLSRSPLVWRARHWNWNSALSGHTTPT